MTRRANAQVDELANLKKVVTAVRHPSAVTAMNEEVFYSARQAERHDAMFNASVTALGSAGGNRGSDCALGSATRVGATLASLLAALTADAAIEWPSTDRVLLSLSKCNYCICESFGQPRNNSLADTVAMPDQLPRAGQKTYFRPPVDLKLLARCRESEEIILFGQIGRPIG
jgi:hypothetical protein